MTPIVLAIVFLAGCRGDEVTHSTYSSRDFARAERLFNDLFEVMDELARDSEGIRGGLDCVQSLVVDTLSNPMTLSVNFGNEDCEALDGQIRKGKIHCSFTGKYSEPGTVVTIIPEDYSVDDYMLAGHITVTFMGENQEEFDGFSYSLVNGKMTAPSGAWFMEWECEEERTMIEGDQSSWWIDDVYEVTGSGQGINRNGSPFKVVIEEPLRMEVLCPWTVGGSLEIAPEGLSIRHLDFGQGECNAGATLTVDNTQYTISQ